MVESIIGRRILYNNRSSYDYMNLSNFDDLSVDAEYIVLDEKRHAKYSSITEILLKNDHKVEKWYPYNHYGILIFNLLSGIFIRYIGPHSISDKGISHNKLYEIFDRLDIEYYYFINDLGVYTGKPKRNYRNGENFFEIISLAEWRDIQINQILDI